MATIGIIPVIGRALCTSRLALLLGNWRPLQSALGAYPKHFLVPNRRRVMHHSILRTSWKGGNTETRRPPRVRCSLCSARPCRGHCRAGGIWVCSRVISHLSRQASARCSGQAIDLLKRGASVRRRLALEGALVELVFRYKRSDQRSTPNGKRKGRARSRRSQLTGAA